MYVQWCKHTEGSGVDLRRETTQIGAETWCRFVSRTEWIDAEQAECGGDKIGQYVPRGDADRCQENQPVDCRLGRQMTLLQAYPSFLRVKGAPNAIHFAPILREKGLKETVHLRKKRIFLISFKQDFGLK